MPQFAYSSLYGELTKVTQIRFDAVSAKNKQLFDNLIYTQYLDWDTPTISTKFEELIGSYNITIAAPTIGDNSKEAILGNDGLKTLSEKVLNHAISKPMTMTDYRKVLELMDSKSLTDAAKTNELIKIMWKDVTDVVGSVEAKLDLLFLKALSNEGKVELNDETNPEGGVKGIIDYNQPEENIGTSKLAWTDDNKDSVDCFEDIQAILDAANDKVTFSKILLTPAQISYICRTKKMKQMVWGSDKSARIVTLRDLNDYMQTSDFPIFEAVRRQIRVQNGEDIKSISPFNANNLVFIPEGKLGVVKNAFANNELKQDEGVTYSNYGRIRVSQWSKGEKDGSNHVEMTKAEVMALPVITEMNGIYTLKTQAGR